MSGYSETYSTNTGSVPYGSSQAGTGATSNATTASRGTYGDQAMSKTSRIATNLSLQAEQLKQKFGGPYQSTGTNHVAGQPYASSQYVGQPHKPGIMDRAKQGIVGGITYSQQGLGYVAAKAQRPGMAQTTITTPTAGGLGQNTSVPAAGQYTSETVPGGGGGYTSTGTTYPVQSAGMPVAGQYSSQTNVPAGGYSSTGPSAVGQYGSQHAAGGGYNTTGTSAGGHNTGVPIAGGGQYGTGPQGSSGFSGAGSAHPGPKYNPWPSSTTGTGTNVPGASGYNGSGTGTQAYNQPSAGNYPATQASQYGNSGSAYTQDHYSSGPGVPVSMPTGTGYQSSSAGPSVGQTTTYQHSGYSSANSATGSGYQPSAAGSQVFGQDTSYQQPGHTSPSTMGGPGFQASNITSGPQMTGQGADYQQPGYSPAAAEAAFSNMSLQGNSINTSGSGYNTIPASTHSSYDTGYQHGSSQAGSLGQGINPNSSTGTSGYSTPALGSQFASQGVTSTGAQGTSYASQATVVPQSVTGPQNGGLPGSTAQTGVHVLRDAGVQPAAGVVTVTSNTASPLVTNPVPGRLGENTPVLSQPAGGLPVSSYNAADNTGYLGGGDPLAGGIAHVPVTGAYGSTPSASTSHRSFPPPVEL